MSNKKLFSMVMCLGVFLLTGVFYNLPAQTNWTKYLNNPVISPTELWEIFGVSDATLLYETGVYKMWYTGGGLDSGDTVGRCRISFATSFDGLNWAKYGVVLETGDSGAWDEGGVETACVIHNDSGYHMWYDGYDAEGFPPISFGYAFSQDSIHWTKWTGNPVLVQGGSGEWDNYFIDSPSVLFENDTFKMWYTGTDTTQVNTLCVGLAFSTDGVNWTKYPGNPVFSPGSSWDSSSVGMCTVEHFGSLYEMWYTGWRLHSGWPPDILSIGYATSADGISWIPCDQNPVLTQSSNSWDSLGVASPDVILTTQYEMWYTGSFINNIGYATAPIGIEEVQSPKLKVQSLEIYPNPFSQKTEIRFKTPDVRYQNPDIQHPTSNISLNIYDLTGRLVKSFFLFTPQSSFITSISWDGRDDNDILLSSGIYFVKLKVEDEFLQTKKILLLR